MAVPAVPQGYSAVTPYLIVKDAARALEFYAKAFGARELMRLEQPGGKIGHAEFRIDDTPVMLADEFPEMNIRSPETLGGSPVSLLLYVEDVDSAFPRALSAGARQVRPLKDQFYGDRTGTLVDPFGHTWTLATHKEDVPPEEMRRRMDEMMKKSGGA